MRSSWKASNVRKATYYDGIQTLSTITQYFLKRHYIHKYAHILPIMEGYTFWAHNGLVLSPIIITNSMLGKRIGEYIQTKARCVYKRKKNKRGRKK